jgi:AraC family transcriptional regulator, exoenzyme S synthesis regulatory protein ExsA
MRIIDIYEYFKQHPKHNKLIGSDFLFVEYKCPLQVEEFQMWTKTHLITYVVNGKKDWISPTKTYSLERGDALFVRKGVYTTKQHLEEEYCVMLFFMTDEFIRKFMADNELGKKDLVASTSEQRLFEIGTNDSFKTLIDSIFHYFKESDSIHQSLLEIKFKELLFNVALNAENKDLMAFFQTINQSAKADMELVMIENFQHDLSMEAFAKLCGRSLSTFKRDFKVELKSTPAKWLMARRLSHSANLLVGTGLNVNQICYECGFKNTSHFIRSFKEKYDSTPNQFRLANSKV